MRVKVAIVAFSIAAAFAQLAARWDYTTDDTLAALSGASARANCVVAYETGFTYDPNLVGRAGEQGPVQLHPRGLLPDFYARGYTDPYDPYQAIPYLDALIDEGQGSNWSPILLGYC